MVCLRGSGLVVSLLIILALSFHIETVKCANILGLFTSHSPSHLIVHMTIAKTLAEKGHNVTVVSGLEIKHTHKNIHHIVIPPTQEHTDARSDMLSQNAIQKKSVFGHITTFLKSMRLMIDMQADILRSEEFNALYDTNSTNFDLVILGQFFNDFQLGVAAKLQAPVIISFSFGANELVNSIVGNPMEVAYVPLFENEIKLGNVMDFKKRVKNFLGAIMMKVLTGAFDSVYVKIYNQLFPDKNFPSYWEMKKNVSLIFTNGHFSEGPLRPNVPAMVEIGGIQIEEQPDPLPKDLENFLNASAQHGAILFSLGSNMHSSFITPETVTILFNVLSGLKQNVIWKWEDLENIPGQSPNIIYKNWLPQNDIMAHPNLKLFVTHAGKSGFVEAQYHGIPMVAMPFMFDQPANARVIEAAGFGKQINVGDITETVFRNVVLEVLNNSTYTENVRQFSEIYRDRPMTPKESVVYWSEYVIRHQGAAHMQSPLVHLNVIEAYNLDIIAFTFLLRYAMFRLLKKIFFACKRTITEMGNGKSKTKFD